LATFSSGGNERIILVGRRRMSGGETGLRVRSQIMAEKPVTIRRERIGQRVGQLGTAEMTRLNVALALVMGLAD
jgi:mRNA-degrading endonuclease toxin of MazEF toxin-antitoxin module